jgi:hypothetical protein
MELVQNSRFASVNLKMGVMKETFKENVKIPVAGFWAMFWRKKLQMAKTFNTGP